MAFPAFLSAMFGGGGGNMAAQSMLGNRIGGLLNRGFESGALSPTGDPQIMEQLRGQGLRDLRNRRRRAQILGQVGNANPMQALAGLQQAESEGSGQLSDFLGSARLSQLQGGQDWLRGMLGQERGYEIDRAREMREERERRRQRRAESIGRYSPLGGDIMGWG